MNENARLPHTPAYARLVGLAHAIDNTTDLPGLIDRAHRATTQPIDPAQAAAFIALMREAGWVAPTP